MKKIFITLVLLLIVGVGVSQAQLATNSWAFGFGGTYPRFVSVNIQPLNSNYGAFLSLQRNFSENFGLRFKAGYSHLEGQWYNASNMPITESTNVITGDLDVLYYLIPCQPISPYLFAGAGAGLKTMSNYSTTSLDANETALAFNMGGGVEWSIDSRWKVLTEYGYHMMFNSELDGAIVPLPSEVNGRDSYMTLNIGLLYYFDKGAPSKMCEPCPQGITMEAKDVDYNRIEDMIVKHIPKEVVKEVVVDRYIRAISDDRLVLVGVNFAFDKSDLLPESYPVLDNAVKLLNEKPNVNVEIEGYTDYIDTKEYNQKLSEERAQTVKNYLVSKGIAENRLTTIGFGKSNPIADNTTEEGRAMNRRIVFRIIK
ncbi:MAG: OmpA family protein [Melioribacteraceae bacterium]